MRSPIGTLGRSSGCGWAQSSLLAAADWPRSACRSLLYRVAVSLTLALLGIGGASAEPRTGLPPTPRTARDLTQEFLAVAGEANLSPRQVVLTKWVEPITISVAGLMPQGVLDALPELGKWLESRIHLPITVTTERSPAGSPGIFIAFRAPSNAEEIASVFKEIGIPLLQEGDVTYNLPPEKLCHVYNRTEQDGRRYRSYIIIDRAFQRTDASVAESLPYCLYFTLLNALGLNNSRPIAYSVTSSIDPSFAITEKDMVLLETLYDPRLRPTTVNDAMIERIELIIDERLQADEWRREYLRKSE